MRTRQLCRVLPVFGILRLVGPFSAPPVRVQPCTPQRLLPAYAHNDYRNRHPLQDALALGFQGVEADYLLIDGELRVGHGRGDTMKGRTLERLYLAPLRDRVRQCGWVQAPGKSFLLTIEYKEQGPQGYRALRQLLAQYRDLVGTASQSGPVRVVLVGWHPALDDMARESPALATVQARITGSGLELPAGDTSLVGLVGLDYGKVMQWKGSGALSTSDRRTLEAIAQARRALPGRLVRAYDVPVNREVYRLLLGAGVDLIGTKTLLESSALL
jgi:hypothetical protein